MEIKAVDDTFELFRKWLNFYCWLTVGKGCIARLSTVELTRSEKKVSAMDTEVWSVLFKERIVTSLDVVVLFNLYTVVRRCSDVLLR